MVILTFSFIKSKGGKTMVLKEMKEMDRKKEVLWSMADLVDPASESFSENPGYTINHVESCSQILDTYID